MPDIDTVAAWRGKTMVDRDGDRIGSISDIYADDETGQPDWALVDTGLFGGRPSFVPIGQAGPAGDDVQVPYEKQQVKDAPRVEADRHLSVAEEQELWRHYGLDHGVDDYDAAGREPSRQGSDTAMTRSEEELRVGTERRERGRIRLRKYVVAEEVTRTVPVQREEVRLEREPITDANVEAATSGPDLSEAEHEVVLHEEEPVVEKRVVPRSGCGSTPTP